jgi:CubicO group peptidase (beta-lactamase class C family)
VRLHLDTSKSPPECAIDSLDQGSRGIPCGDVAVSGTSLSLAVPRVHGTLAGTISADGNTLTTTWTQGSSPLPLVLARQAVRGPRSLDPALPPVAIGGLKAVLDADLAVTVASGDLAPATGGGVTIGVLSHGERLVVAYGAAKDDSVFEIGSITKTFTGLLLAQMVEQKKARLDEPVRALLPVGTVAAPASGGEITLLDLSVQRSGLPRMPDNFKPANPENPNVDYDEKALYAYLAEHGVALPEKQVFGYSNLGVALLGNALAHRAGATYEELLRKEVTSPLGMRETMVTLSPALRARFVPGHDGSHKPVPAWDFTALVGAGGIRSTAADMLTYLEAQLHPDHLPPQSRQTPEGKTLAAAIGASHEVRAEASEGMHIALNWFRRDSTGTYWHNGATGGYSSFAMFRPEDGVAIVVLSNTTSGDESLVEDVAVHVAQRLLGRPAVSLAAAHE